MIFGHKLHNVFLPLLVHVIIFQKPLAYKSVERTDLSRL